MAQEKDQDEHRYCFAIKKPSSPTSNQRFKGFALSKVMLPAGKPRTDLKLPQIDIINRLYRDGTLSYGDALKQLEQLKADLYKARDAAKPKRLFNSQNAKVLDDYWEAEYSDRDLVDPTGHRSDILLAISLVGAVSLVVADKKAIQEQVDKAAKDADQQRRAVSRLNQVLKFLGRGFALRKKRPMIKEVKYLTLGEFERVIIHLKEPKFIAMCKAAFVSGARAGELFPLDSTKLRETYVWIRTQLDDKKTERETKNRKERRAFIIKERRQWLAEWLAIEDRETIRNASHAAMFRLACRKTFPGNKSKHLKFHDIRHSYAIYLLQVKRAELSLVALSLGNSNHVCEKYYAGFVLTDYGIDHLDRL